MSDTPLWSAIGVLLLTTGTAASLAGTLPTGFSRAASFAATLLVLSAWYRRRDGGGRIAAMTETAAAWIVFSASGCLLTYLCARNAHPYVDAVLVRTDALLGFHWLAWERTIAAHPALRTALAIAYGSLPAQICGACVVLPFVADGRRGFALLRQAFIALLITCACFWAFPAKGACPTFLGAACNADWLADLTAMRGGVAPHLDLRAMHGIVTLPSYHAVLAVLFIRAFRGRGLLTAGVVVLNAAMIVSALSAGSHYLTDIIAGACVAMIAIAACDQAEARPLISSPASRRISRAVGGPISATAVTITNAKE